MSDFLCLNCGYQGKPKKFMKGSIVLELTAWLLFILPGIAYSIWRRISRYKGCPKCGHLNMIPIDSPVAQKILNTN